MEKLWLHQWEEQDRALTAQAAVFIAITSYTALIRFQVLGVELDDFCDQL